MKIPKALEPVIVEWADAYTNDSGLVGEDKAKILEDTEQCVVLTPAWLIGKTETDYVFMNDYCVAPAALRGYRGVYAVPIGMVKKLHRPWREKRRRPSNAQEAPPLCEEGEEARRGGQPVRSVQRGPQEEAQEVQVTPSDLKVARSL